MVRDGFVKPPALPRVLIAGGCIFGLAAWIFYLRVFRGEIGEDWMVFFTATRAVLDHHTAMLYDGTRLTAVLNARFASWLAHPLPLHPWLYPPQYLLFLMPFGTLPPALGMAAFLAFGFLCAALALCAVTGEPRRRALYIAALLCNPATAIVVLLGQNTFLTLALMVGGIAVMKKRPLLAGLLLGALTFKPQFWLLIPVALVAARQWRTLAAALATAAALALASLAVFGPGVWLDWFRLMTAPSAQFAQWQTIARLNGQSLFTVFSLLHAGPQLANVAQAAGALAAAAAVWLGFRRPLPEQWRLAVLLAATTLAAPHIIDYDALLLGVAALLFLDVAWAKSARIADGVLAACVWLSPLANPPSVFVVGLLTPLFVALLVLRMLDERDARATEARAVPAISAGRAGW